MDRRAATPGPQLEDPEVAPHERPPEEWLFKAWDGEVLVDLIIKPKGLSVTDAVIERGDQRTIMGIDVPVMAIEDVISTKLLALGEHALDYEGLLQMGRSLREQVDWDEIWERTRESPFAKAYFVLIDELGIRPARRAEGAARSRVRVVMPGDE